MNNPFSPFGMPGMDPSKMDPKVLMQLSQLIQELPPEKLLRIQTLMHNMQAGFDVRKEMEDFEKSLPPGFKEKIMQLMAGQMGAMGGMGAGAYNPSTAAPIHAESTPVESASSDEGLSAAEMNVRDARLTVLRAVAAGSMTPEDAEQILFRD